MQVGHEGRAICREARMHGMYIDVAHRQVIEQTRAFTAEHFSEADIQQWVKDQGMPINVRTAFYSSEPGRMGLPVDLGGIPSDFLSQILIVEELHRASGAMLPFTSHFLSLRLLQTLGGSKHFDLVKRMLDTKGEIGFSEAITEPAAGTDTHGIVTTTTQQGDKVLLNGTKMFVSNGQFAPFIMAAAKEEDASRLNRSLTFWLFRRDLPGVDTYPIETIGQRMNPQALITFENVELGPENAIGERGDGFKAMKGVLDIGRLLICATSLGLAQAAMDDAVAHASKRESFGTALYEIPAIQDKLANMEVRLRSMRALVYDAATLFDAGQDIKLAASLAKYMVPKAAVEVASDAMQVFGALGYTDLTRVGRIWNECRGNQIAQGTDEIMPRIAARAIVEEYGQE